MKTLTSTLIFILLFNGCYSLPFITKEKTYIHPETQYKNMIVKKSFDLLKFADRKKEQVVNGDILIIKSKRLTESFAILTLIAEDEMELYVMYNIEYLTNVINLLSKQMEKEGHKYDWSWNQMILDFKRQLEYVE